VIFTQDGDFLRLAASDVSHAGIVYHHEVRRLARSSEVSC
jgi:hypothetical protein